MDAGGVAGRLAGGQHVADVGLVDHVGAAVMLGGRQADVDVDAEGFGDFFAEVLAECATGDAADDLAEDEAEADHVIALCGARLPPGFGSCEVVADGVPVEGLVRSEAATGADDAGAMAHHHGDGDVLLSGLGEFGPVLGDGCL